MQELGSLLFGVYVIVWLIRKIWIDLERLGAPVEFEPERKRVQMHLSTAMVMLLATACLMWLNFTPCQRTNSYKFEGQMGGQSGIVSTIDRDYGWPAEFCQVWKSQYSTDNPAQPPIRTYTVLGWVPLILNIAAWLFILRRVWCSWEWWLTCWRTPRKQQVD